MKVKLRIIETGKIISDAEDDLVIILSGNKEKAELVQNVIEQAVREYNVVPKGTWKWKLV